MPNLLDNAKSGLQARVDELAAEKANIAKLFERKSELIRAPFAAPDWIDWYCAAIDAAAERYLSIFEKCIGDMPSRYALETFQRGTAPDPLYFASVNSRGMGAHMNIELRREALCFFFGPLIKERLRVAFQEAPIEWAKNPGPPMAERVKELTELDERIAKSNARMQELRAELEDVRAMIAER